MRNNIVLITWGGIGDALVCTPALRALRAHYPKHKIILYTRWRNHLDVLKHNPNIDSLRHLSVMSMLRYPFHLIAYLWNRNLVPHTNMTFQKIRIREFLYKKNAKRIAGELFNIEIERDDVEIFLTEKEKNDARKRLMPYKNVVIMHIFSRCSQNHLWKLERWNELVARFPQFTFIQLGHSDEPKVEGALDWRSTTTLREAFSLLSMAKSFVGVDSVLSHATNAFNIPGVVLFGDSSPLFWGHDNNLNIYKKVACSPCYYYLWINPCPYDHECMELISVDEVAKALVTQMNK